MARDKTELVSMVIPVYNEAAHLRACLDAIAAQTISPFEVIVVDNNSVDATATIAASYPFVRLLHEPRQGVVHARRCGFDAARGAIIGRIDADTVIEPDWTQKVMRIFATKTVAAVSGGVSYYDFPLPRLAARLDLAFRQWLADKLGDEVFLYGANMAIRRSVWQQVSPFLCLGGGLHEDFDLAIHTERLGEKVVFQKQLLAGVSLRRFEGSLMNFWRYARLSPVTYRRHGRTSQRHMYVVLIAVTTMYGFIWLSHRLYDVKQGRLSLRRLVSSAPAPRVNPATFVD